MGQMRVDALKEVGHERLRMLTGRVLDPWLDDELQNIVTQAALELTTPIALVTLVLARTQFFRAHFGLPSDLAAACATDRDVSFCQFVVRDGAPFEVKDAELDDRVPRDLVVRYGVRAYLGMPVRVVNQVVGSLCVLDTQPREFRQEERVALEALACRVSARLTELAQARDRAASELTQSASRPVFGELRNILQAISGQVTLSRVSVTELAPMARLSDQTDSAPPWGALVGAAQAVRDLQETQTDLEGLVERLQASVLAMERLLRPLERAPLAEVIEAASRLALHSTRLVGGMRWSAVPPDTSLGISQPQATSILVRFFNAFAEHLGERRSTKGIDGAVNVQVDDVLVSLRSPGLLESQLRSIAKVLRPELLPFTEVALTVNGDVMELHFPSGAA